jgi:hypothetical protein
MAYIGQEPGQGQAERFTFTASGSETVVSADDDGRVVGYTVGQVSVYLNGVKLVVGTDCVATNGSTITGLAALAASDVVEIVALSAFSPSDTVSAATGGTFAGNVTHTADIRGGTLKAADGTAAITIADSTGKVTFAGDFQVDGTTTTVNSTTLTVDDKNIEMGSVASPTDSTADGGGITLKGTTDKTILWENDTDSWNFNQNIETSTTTKVKQKGAFMENSFHQSWVMGG